MIEPTFTSMQAMEILADDGLKACRERITKLADDLFGREPKAKGRTRRITVSQMSVIREAFHLIDDERFPRQLVIEMFVHPNKVTDALAEDMYRSKTALAAAVADAESGLSQFQDAASADERLEAARCIRRVFSTIRKVRRLVAA